MSASRSRSGAASRASGFVVILRTIADFARAEQEKATLKGFAPDFVASLFRGENQVFARSEDMDHLLEGLRLAGLPD